MTSGKERKEDISANRESSGVKEAAAKLDELIRSAEGKGMNREEEDGENGEDGEDWENTEDIVSQKGSGEGDVALATETMARILEQQGHADRAAMMRKKVIKTAQWNVLERAEESRLEQEIPLENTVLLACEDSATGVLATGWNITTEAMEAAFLAFPECLRPFDCGFDATGACEIFPVLRLSATFAETESHKEGAGVLKKIFDLPLQKMQGMVWLAPASGRPLWVCASVGLKASTGRFHSVTHSELVKTDGFKRCRSRV